jgi:hypothetical protein
MKWADLTATSRQFPWPPVGSFVTAYGHFSMAADTGLRTLVLVGSVMRFVPRWRLVWNYGTSASSRRFWSRDAAERAARRLNGWEALRRGALDDQPELRRWVEVWPVSGPDAR